MCWRSNSFFLSNICHFGRSLGRGMNELFSRVFQTFTLVELTHFWLETSNFRNCIQSIMFWLKEQHRHRFWTRETFNDVGCSEVVVKGETVSQSFSFNKDLKVRFNYHLTNGGWTRSFLKARLDLSAPRGNLPERHRNHYKLLNNSRKFRAPKSIIQTKSKNERAMLKFMA